MRARFQKASAAGLAILISTFTAVSVTGKEPSGSPAAKPVGKNRARIVSPELALLDPFGGAWKVTEKHFNANGDVVAKVEGTEENKWILGHRTLRRVYRTSSETRSFHAIGMLTWNAVVKVYQGAWFDNTSTSGPTLVKGEWVEDDRAMVFTLESVAPDGSTLRYKVVDRFVDEENRVATTYLITGSKSIKRLEVQYKRTIPCPSNFNRIIDELTPTRRGNKRGN